MGNSESSLVNGIKPEQLVLEGAALSERGFYGGAVVKFKKAHDLYKEVDSLSSAGRALRLAAESGLQMSQPDYELAAKAFEEVGILYLTNKISAFSVKMAFANSIFCLLAAGRVSSAKGKYDEFITKDSLFESSLEGVASQSILEACVNGHRNQASDRIEAFKEVRSVPMWLSMLLTKIVERL
jgi:tetratricopeptide (TPR) repeat protein